MARLDFSEVACYHDLFSTSSWEQHRPLPSQSVWQELTAVEPWMMGYMMYFIGAAMGSLVTYARMKQRLAPRPQILKGRKIALSLEGNLSDNLAFRLEERIFAAGGLVVSLPPNWKAHSSVRLTDASEEDLPEIIIEGDATVKNGASVGVRFYLGQGRQIGTYVGYNGNTYAYDAGPLFDHCFKRLIQAIDAWEKNQPYVELEEALDDAILPRTVEEAPVAKVTVH